MRRGQTPKKAGMRQRRNRTSTAATLPSEAESAGREVPEMPEREGGWHKMVVQWWSDVWTSPMAAEYLEQDKHGLYILAELYQRRWTIEGDAALTRLSQEIRQQEIRFGLSPIDRRRLQWEVEKGEQAEERTKRRRSKPVKGDPRKVLKAI